MLILPNMGTELAQFLIQQFSFLGFEGQYWMLVAAGVVAIFLYLGWRNRDGI